MIKTEAIYGKIMTLLHNIALERRECLLRTKTVDKYLRNSIVYGYAVTQPFLLYAEPAQGLQQMIIGESEIVKYGENSEIVRHIQQKLMNLGYYEDKIDGTYGLLTEHAVKGFQSSYHIEVTGQVNEQTMKEMITEEKRRQFKNIQSEIDRIYYGASNKDVTKVQEVLFYYGYYQGDIDGIYGPLTDKALEEASQIMYFQVNQTQSIHRRRYPLFRRHKNPLPMKRQRMSFNYKPAVRLIWFKLPKTL